MASASRASSATGARDSPLLEILSTKGASRPPPQADTALPSVPIFTAWAQTALLSLLVNLRGRGSKSYGRLVPTSPPPGSLPEVPGAQSSVFPVCDRTFPGGLQTGKNQLPEQALLEATGELVVGLPRPSWISG